MVLAQNHIQNQTEYIRSDLKPYMMACADTPELAGTSQLGSAGAAQSGVMQEAERNSSAVLLQNVFWRKLRSVDSVENACVLLLDASVEGWPVVYASTAWQHWSGM